MRFRVGATGRIALTSRGKDDALLLSIVAVLLQRFDSSGRGSWGAGWLNPLAIKLITRLMGLLLAAIACSCPQRMNKRPGSKVTGVRITKQPGQGRQLNRRCFRYFIAQNVDPFPGSIHFGISKTSHPPPPPIDSSNN